MREYKTQAEFEADLAKLEPKNDSERNAFACLLLGHSRIIMTCFGYVSCARCLEQIGDTLGSCFDTRDCVIVGHNCGGCHANYDALGWQDKLFCPDPFKEEGAKDA